MPKPCTWITCPACGVDINADTGTCKPKAGAIGTKILRLEQEIRTLKGDTSHAKPTQHKTENGSPDPAAAPAAAKPRRGILDGILDGLLGSDGTDA